MISIHQPDIALYLYDYSSLIYLMVQNSKMKPISLFKKYLIDSGRKIENIDEYYNRMLRVVYIFIKMKIFSISEDYTLKQKNNFINNDDLDLSFMDTKITGNRNALSNKKLLQKIRDGFNHSSEENELYKISPNGKYIEFSFHDPSPIKIKLSIDDISSLTTSIGDVAQTFQFFSFDKPTTSTIKEYVEKLKITRHYFPKKVDPSTISSVLQYEADCRYDDAISLVKTINQTSEKEITLTESQVDSILNNIESLINSKVMTLEELQSNLRDIIIILLNKELPIPILKLDNYLLDSYFVITMLPHKVFSYSDMIEIFIKGLKSEVKNPVNKYSDIFNVYRQFVFKTYFSNPDEKMAYAYLLFIEYVISNFKPVDNEITIGSQTVEYNKLRNSLVHGRWHLEKDKIAFYDALPNVENELEYNWSMKIDLYELHEYCQNVLKNKLDTKGTIKLKRCILSADYNK